MRSYFLSRLAPIILAFLSLGLLSRPASAATLGVPSQYATIQSAVNASQNGDTVLIADGTYTGPGNVDIDSGGKNITVTSQNGAATTIIDCGGSASANHRGFYLHTYETNAIISGLTIENGYEGSSYGGGIYSNYGNGNVQNCILKNNTALVGGGMASIIASGPLAITNCSFIGNKVFDYGQGAGIYNDNAGSSALSVVNCRFSGNSSDSEGGGLYNFNSSSGTLAVTGCVLDSNTAPNGGAGVFNYASSGAITVANCVLSRNAAAYGGSGISNATDSGSINVTNCTLTGNTSSSGNIIGTLDNDNTNTSSGTITAANNILYGDSGPEYSSSGPGITIGYCDIQGGYAGTRNINADPLFASASDLHLRVGSPCLQAGTAGGAPAATIDGRTRPNPPSIGAYEMASSTLNVPSQYSTIQAAVNAAQNGDIVLIADGTYTGPGNVDIDFGGKNITVTSQNGSATTIIDCLGSSAANHRGFYLHSGETSAAITGLTIQNGYESYGSGAAGYGCGGGIYNASLGLTVQQCVFKNNQAINAYGGGVYSNVSNAIIHITNCVFTGNAATYSGGGIGSVNSVSDQAFITNCVFTGNTADSGGAIYDYNGEYSSTYVVSSTLTANPAASGGSGIYVYDSSYGFYSGVTYLISDILYGDAGSELYGTVLGGVNYCDIQGAQSYNGAGNIDADPFFFNAPTDLHLQAFSPCLGAGSSSSAPPTTIDGRTRPNPPSIGAYEVAATGANATATRLTSSLNPSSPGQSVTFTATVTGSGGTPTGSVTFLVDGNPQSHTTLSSGTATYITSALTGGSHIVQATYSGDTSFAFSVSPSLTQTVHLAGTSTALTSSLNPSVYGQSVTLTATVTGSSPTGTVTFTDAASSTALGTAGISGGVAVLNTSALTAGRHQITAAYSGDSNNSPSISPSLTQVINQAGTTTALSSSLNPSLVSQSVTFTVSVSSAGTSVVTPTGTVTFTVDGVAQTPTGLSNGYYASYTTAALTAGSHAVTAIYSGDSNFTGSASPTLTQTVNAHVSPQYVSPTGSDSNSGTQAAPKLTIQAAINATLSGDTVIVADGTYTGPGDVDLSFSGHNITVTSQHGPGSTVINCAGSANAQHRGFFLNGGETGAVIAGFTVENGYEYAEGGGIFAIGAGLTVQNCILQGNYANYGGGIFSSSYGDGRGSQSSSLAVTNCVLLGNTAVYSGGGISSAGGTIAVTNCTLTGNTAASGGGVYGQSDYPPSSGTFTLTNDILYGDTGGEIGTGQATINAAYCDVQGGYAGTGNINADPLFVSSSNLHLQYNSRCAGAGTAAGVSTTIDGKTRPNPPSIGAYEAVMTGTATTLASSLNPSAAGRSVTFTAIVAGTSGTPTGTVTFSLDGAAQAPVTLSAGQAAFSTSSLSAGSHTLTAAYSGDQFNAASASAILTQTVSAPPPAGQVRFAPRPGYGSRMVGGVFQGSHDGTTYTTLATVTQTPASNQYSTLPTSADPKAYRFLRYLAPNGTCGNISELEFDSGTGTSLTKILGTPFGTAGSYNNNGNDFTKVFDGNTSTFFDAPSPGNGDYAGIDQGAPVTTNSGQVRFAPRTGYGYRMVGGVFQGSTDGSAYTTIATVTQAPPDNQYSTLPTSADPATFRFLRYLAPNGAYGNVAEVEFDSSSVKLTGTGFGTPGSYNNSGNGFTKALDGSVSTFFDAPAPGNGDYAGIDQGAPTTGAAGQVRFAPRTGYGSRMVGGIFQGSHDGMSYTTLATVTQVPVDGRYTMLPTSVDPATFRYLRYLAPDGTCGNIAELEFDSNGVKLTGAPFGTAGSYNNNGNDFTKVFDGNTSTFFDAPSPGNGDYAGIDQGAGH